MHLLNDWNRVKMWMKQNGLAGQVAFRCRCFVVPMSRRCGVHVDTVDG